MPFPRFGSLRGPARESHTVQLAYRELEREGLIYTQRGQGTSSLPSCTPAPIREWAGVGDPAALRVELWMSGETAPEAEIAWDPSWLRHVRDVYEVQATASSADAPWGPHGLYRAIEGGLVVQTIEAGAGEPLTHAVYTARPGE